jgi:GNAT superfamily N-acetyltransferase
MGWCTTSDLDRFAAAASGYLRSRAAENTLLLSAAQAARSGTAGWRSPGAGRPQAAGEPGLLFGWWEPPDGGEPRGAFVHDPAVPLLISGRAPEMAAALVGTLVRMGRPVCGVDAPTEAADAFAAAWSQRAGTAVRAHRTCRVYRFTGLPPQTPPQGFPALPGTGAWVPPEIPAPAGRLRVATAADQGLLTDWLAAFAAEATERLGSPSAVAADLISYGGAVLWETPHKPGRFRDAPHYLAIPRHRDAAPCWEPVALATLDRPVAGTVRISVVYTLPERRGHGYAVALTQAVSRALLDGPGPAGTAGPAGVPGVLGSVSARGCVREVVLITDKNRPDHWGSRFGYQLVGERAVLRFGPATGPMPRPQSTKSMPRLPTGPLPRLPRLRH